MSWELFPKVAQEDVMVKRRVDEALRQALSTSAVIRSALEDEDLFAPPRLEMLKEVLVRAAAIRWQSEEADADQRRRWGPWLDELFNSGQPPAFRVEAEVILVKLRANRPPERRPLPGDDIPASLATITEPLARILLGIDEPPAIGPAGSGGGGGSMSATGPSRPRPAPRPAEVLAARDQQESEPILTENDLGSAIQPDPVVGSTNSVPAVTEPPMVVLPIPPAPQTTMKENNWPPPLNALGIIGQHEAARELADLADKSKGWDERFPDKLLVGPAGVGKTSLAYEVATRLLGLKPILFNGADLRRPDMIVERLIKEGKVPEDALASSDTVLVDPCVMFIDEVHAIAPSVATALLSALDERRTITVGNTPFSFEDVVFLLATTDPGRLSEALLSRTPRTPLRPYTHE
jgi:hypothetical protein